MIGVLMRAEALRKNKIKYRQLDADGKRIIDEQVDFQLFKQQQNAEKEEENLG